VVGSNFELFDSVTVCCIEFLEWRRGFALRGRGGEDCDVKLQTRGKQNKKGCLNKLWQDPFRICKRNRTILPSDFIITVAVHEEWRMWVKIAPLLLVLSMGHWERRMEQQQMELPIALTIFFMTSVCLLFGALLSNQVWKKA
jgi:hypothetical protein